MKKNAKREAPEIIIRKGKPAAVILDIEHYKEMLERLEDIKALKMLVETRKTPLKFRRLGNVLKEYSPGV
jgi:prevent-host-death family protein